MYGTHFSDVLIKDIISDVANADTIGDAAHGEALPVEVYEASVGSIWYRRRLCQCWFYWTVDGAT